jgi:hypothetical protein
MKKTSLTMRKCKGWRSLWIKEILILKIFKNEEEKKEEQPWPIRNLRVGGGGGRKKTKTRSCMQVIS